MRDAHQHHCPDRRRSQRKQKRIRVHNPQLREDPSPNHRPDQSQHDVSNASKARAARQFPRQPPRNQPDQQPTQQPTPPFHHHHPLLPHHHHRQQSRHLPLHSEDLSS